MRKILLIDDEDSARRLLGLSLRKDGYDVVEAGDGGSGLEVFRREVPNIVITDIKMPGVSGIEVLSGVKEINPEVEVIVVTGHADMELAIKCLQLDASDFITKPISDQSLSVALTRAEKRLAMRAQLKAYTEDMENLVREKTRELEKSYKSMEAFYLMQKQISEKTSLTEVLEFITKKIKEVVNCETLPLILNIMKTGLVVVEGYGLEESDLESMDTGVVTTIKEPTGAIDARLIELSSKVINRPPQLVVPMRKNGDTIGIVLVCASGIDRIKDEDIRFMDLLLSQASGAIRRVVLQEEKLRELHKRLSISSRYGNLVGKDHKMQQIYDLVSDVAPTNATILIQGESGTGKELIARAIHINSLRRNGPFIVVNCSSYPETLLEGELFGYEKGAFTGAVRKRLGCFERAHGGTIFLDEIGEIPSNFQVKLLRVVQVQEFERLGGDEPIRVDIRIIAATNKELRKEVEKGSFREDLYYRLNIIPICLPPLRVRKNDIPVLIEHFRDRLNSSLGKRVLGTTPEAMRIIMDYDWPGNVRELENTIEHAFILTKGDFMGKDSLPAHLRLPTEAEEAISSFEENEVRFLTKILEQYRWNKLQVAKKLNISRSTLYAKMRKYNIDRQSV